MAEITDEEKEKVKRILKRLDEAAKLTDEEIDDTEEISRELGQNIPSQGHINRTTSLPMGLGLWIHVLYCSLIGVSLFGDLCIDWNTVISFIGILVISIAIGIVIHFLQVEPWNLPGWRKPR